MFSFNFPKEFPAPSITTFVALQTLDLVTTLIGLKLGAQESSIFVARIMQLGPVAGTLISKIFACLLAATALRYKRPRVLVFLNFWFAAVVTWNLGTILYSGFMSRR
jgi:hypothetical protein